MNETRVLDSPFCLENEAGVLQDNNAINSFIVVSMGLEARSVFQAGFVSPLFSSKRKFAPWSQCDPTALFSLPSAMGPSQGVLLLPVSAPLGLKEVSSASSEGCQG